MKFISNTFSLNQHEKQDEIIFLINPASFGKNDNFHSKSDGYQHHCRPQSVAFGLELGRKIFIQIYFFTIPFRNIIQIDLTYCQF